MALARAVERQSEDEVLGRLQEDASCIHDKVSALTIHLSISKPLNPSACTTHLVVLWAEGDSLG